MARESMSGMNALLQLFDNLPAATEQELKEDLPKIGSDVLAAQKEAVAVRTGDLFRGLSVQVLGGGFKIRVGLVGSTSGLTGKTTYGLFYGRFVEFGRHSQIVTVERRRRVGGRLLTRNRRKRAEDIVTTYSLPVPAAPARPFVRSAAAETAALDAVDQLADFWTRAFARTGAPAV